MNRVVKGVGFEKGDKIAFEQATLSISTLPKWANPNIVKLNHTEARNRPIRFTISVEERADESAIVSFRGEEVKISLRFLPKQESMRRGVITRILVQDHCHLIIEKADGSKMPLDSILSVAGAMMDVLSICCNETPTVTSISVNYEKGKQPPANVYVQMKGHGAEERKSNPYPALDLKDLGGMGGVARWIEVKERFGDSVALLASNWYNEKAYNEDSLSRMYAAVEGLLTRKNNRSRAKMNATQLAGFVAEAIPSFSSITSSLPEEWAKRVKEIRDQKIAHSDPISMVVADGRTMHVMTNILYVAGASFLLKEMGLAEEQVEHYIASCSKILLLSEQQ